MTDDETDENDEIPDDLNCKLYVCDVEGCDATYLTERQLRAHQSKHSNYFENLRDENDE